MTGVCGRSRLVDLEMTQGNLYYCIQATYLTIKYLTPRAPLVLVEGAPLATETLSAAPRPLMNFVHDSLGHSMLGLP